ncbi:MAG: sulfatase [Gammaproteobacteria bacterium]|nr:sulfatase [Gammaproteobacteria bacterium]MYJ74425.1 sulfatase [Gammaproteobacteria bacterium]
MNPVARFLLLFALFNVGVTQAQESPTRPNVLFIAVDDLNHWVGHLDGHPGTLTPNIDRLAGRGVTFSRAYAAAPLCNPSRLSLLTGVMPAHSGIYGNFETLREQLPDAVTLPQYFRQHGYTVKGGGKIFHAGSGDEEAWDEFFPAAGKSKAPQGKALQEKSKKTPKAGMWAPWGPSTSDDSSTTDAQIADRIVAELEGQHGKPFFLAYGTYKPHLPWNVPRRYFEMHPMESVVLPTVIESDLADIPPFGRRLAAEVLDISNDRNFAAEDGDHANVLRYNQWRPAVQGYLASITFADAQVGKVLDALADSPCADKTIVVLWGDHGYHLGQKEHWRKHTLWEDGLRTTLVISGPGFGRDSRSDRVVSLLDLYPTLIELAGLEPRDGMDGQSIVPLLREPDLDWPRPVVSTYGFQNHSLRTERWRYIRYHDGTEELYDHDADPNEWTNLAAAPVEDEHREVMTRLARHFPQVNVPGPEQEPF